MVGLSEKIKIFLILFVVHDKTNGSHNFAYIHAPCAKNDLEYDNYSNKRDAIANGMDDLIRALKRKKQMNETYALLNAMRDLLICLDKIPDPDNWARPSYN